jgi:hypothetical protein
MNTGLTAIVEQLPNDNYYLTITGLDKRVIHSAVMVTQTANGNIPLKNPPFEDYIYDIIGLTPEIAEARKKYRKGE